MYICYLIVSLFQIFLAKLKYRKYINPISLYILLWNAVILLYEMRLVYLYDISIFCWVTVILFQTIYFGTCYLGDKFIISNGEYREFDKDIVWKMIIILSTISAMAIIPNFINFVHRYSFNFMDQMNSVYSDRLTNSRGYELIPYLGTFSYLAVVFSGIYYRRFGLEFKIIIPIALTILDTLPGGGRFGLVIIVLLFILPKALFPTNNKKVKRKKLKKRKNKVLVVGIILTLVILFWQMSSVRSRWITENQYMSPIMKKMVSINPVFYKSYTYIVEPFVALSEYLKDMTFNFGVNTFGFFINILNKLGLNLTYERYQSPLFTPLECNVATYIRELVQDFSYVGAILCIAFIGSMVGILYKTAKTKNSFFCEAMCAIWGCVIVMSFYMFFLRESIFWIMILSLPLVVKIMSFMQCRRGK